MNAFCSYFNAGICRSCTEILLPLEAQLQIKEDRVSKVFASYPHLKILPTHHSRERGFRNKAKFSVTGTKEAPVIGLVGENNLDQGREVLECPVHHPELNNIISSLPSFISKASLPPYQIQTKTGELKGLILYHSEESQETYLRFILRSKEALDRIKKHLDQLQRMHPSLKVVSANIQSVPHAILEGPEEIILTDLNFIHHQLGKREQRLGPKGFVQTNQSVATGLYSQAAIWVEELKIKKFSEIFCGQGTFSFFCAPHIETGLGVEIDGEAVKEANRSALEKGLGQLQFIQASAAEVKDKVLDFSPELLLVNPPRRGLGDSVNWISEGPWQHLLYSSCQLETLTKDLEQLTKHFTPVRAQIFDMFPHTQHFETLVLFSKTSDVS
jgi:23S rRNA (uracil747-C5)-methyltransferase